MKTGAATSASGKVRRTDTTGHRRHRSGGDASPILRRFVRWATWGFVAAFLMTSAWSMANPINAAPDEAGHAVTAYATVHGQIGSVNPTVPAVYADLTERSLLLCHHESWSTDARCQKWGPSEKKPPRQAFTQFGTYNPVYYVLVGWPTQILQPHLALYAIRVVSAFWFSLIFGAALGAAAVGFLPRFASCAPLVALTPMMVFLGGAINPNSIEIVGSLLAWISLTILLGSDTTSVTRRLMISLATIGFASVILTRLLSPLWVVVIVVTVASATGSWPKLWTLITRSRYFQAHLAALAAAGLFAVWWTVDHPPVFVGGVHNRPDSFRELLQISIHQVIWDFPKDVVPQTFGVLGWVEFPVYAIVPVMTVAWGSVLLMSLLVPGPRRGRLTMTLLLAFWILFPALLESYMWGGVGWQGRYGLPIALGIPILGLHLIARQTSTLNESAAMASRGTRILSIAVIACNIYTFALNYPRYAAGWDDRWQLRDYVWQPPLGFLPWLLGFLGGSLMLTWVAWRSTRARRSQVSPQTDPAVLAAPTDRAV